MRQLKLDPVASDTMSASLVRDADLRPRPAATDEVSEDLSYPD
jgi:hypothetical protein